jgi:hypothetical protein
MPLANGADRSFFLDNRIVSSNATAFEKIINHRKNVLEWLQGDMRTSAFRDT